MIPVNRGDAYGLWTGNRWTAARGALDEDTMVRARAGEVVVGLYTTSVEQTCRWICWDIDNHGGDEATAEANLLQAQGLFFKLQEMGAEPLLEDSDGQGSYHVWVVFEEPIPARDAWSWARVLCPKGAEHFPKQAEARNGGLGNFVRLPGKHHHRDHRSRFWLRGEDWADFADFGDDYARASPDIVPESPPEGRPEGTGAPQGAFREGGRNSSLASFAGRMRRSGAPETVILAALLEMNRSQCRPPLDSVEVGRIAKSIAGYEPEDPIDPSEENRDGPASRVDALRGINGIFSDATPRRLRVVRVVKRGATDSVYEMEIEGVGTVGIGGIGSLADFSALRLALAESTGIMLRLTARARWNSKGAQWALDASELIPLSTTDEETIEWLESCIANRGPLDVTDEDGAEAASRGSKWVFFRYEESLYVRVSALVIYLRTMGVSKEPGQGIGRRLSMLGFVWSRPRLGATQDARRVRAYRATPEVASVLLGNLGPQGANKRATT